MGVKSVAREQGPSTRVFSMKPAFTGSVDGARQPV